MSKKFTFIFPSPMVFLTSLGTARATGLIKAEENRVIKPEFSGAIEANMKFRSIRNFALILTSMLFCGLDSQAITLHCEGVEGGIILSGVGRTCVTGDNKHTFSVTGFGIGATLDADYGASQISCTQTDPNKIAGIYGEIDGGAGFLFHGGASFLLGANGACTFGGVGVGLGVNASVKAMVISRDSD
jgi:hypothetical protein